MLTPTKTGLSRATLALAASCVRCLEVRASCGASCYSDCTKASPPPPPSAPPNPPPPASYAVKMAVTIAGDVSTFTPEVLTPMRQKVADEASVPLAAVEATATAGSVTIDFTVNMQSEAAAGTALTAITAKLADNSAASTFLSTAELTVAVEAIVDPITLVLVSPPPPPAAPPPAPPPDDDDSGSGALVGGIVGGLVGACLLVGVLVFFYCKSKKKKAAYLEPKKVAVAASKVTPS